MPPRWEVALGIEWRNHRSLSARITTCFTSYSLHGKHIIIELIVPLRAIRDGNLMLHRDVPVFRCRLHDGKADLQRRQTPAAAVQQGLPHTSTS